MAIAVLQEVAESIGQMHETVMRAPESAEARLSVEQTVRLLDRFMASGEIRVLFSIQNLTPDVAQGRSESLKRLLGSLRDIIDVGVQVEQVGGQVDWIVPLERAFERLRRVLERFGVIIDRPKDGPIVSRLPGPNEPTLSVSTKIFRVRGLTPYIDLAMRDARPTEITPGQWYAELERFPGVWGDGETAQECLEVLADVLHEWLVLKVIFEDGDAPILDDIDPRVLIRAELPS